MSPSNVVSFAEETCFSGETFRSVRREINFSIVGYGKALGRELRGEFVADFGMWYDYSDDYMIGILNEEFPDINWGWFVFHKKIDHSSIDILHPETTRCIGSIHVRRGPKGKLSGENLGGTVMSWKQVQDWKVKRDAKAAEQPENQDG